LHDHLVVALVVVDRLDDPVAPAPDVRLAEVVVAPVFVAVGVAPHVHPVPAPALAVMRTGQQASAELFIPLLGFVVWGWLQLLTCRRQTDQIEIDSTDKDVPRRLPLRLQTALLVLGGDECIDRVLDPGSVLHFGRSWPLYDFEWPPAIAV